MAAASKLDRIDRRILAALQDDARITNQALSDVVALSPSACLARVRRLEDEGVIQGYHARLDPFALQLGLVLYAEITLNGHGSDELSSFEELINGMEEIVEASHVTGDYDYLLKVVTEDMPSWTRIADALKRAQVGVARINTRVMMGKPKFFVGYPTTPR